MCIGKCDRASAREQARQGIHGLASLHQAVVRTPGVPVMQHRRIRATAHEDEQNEEATRTSKAVCNKTLTA